MGSTLPREAAPLLGLAMLGYVVTRSDESLEALYAGPVAGVLECADSGALCMTTKAVGALGWLLLVYLAFPFAAEMRKQKLKARVEEAIQRALLRRGVAPSILEQDASDASAVARGGRWTDE